MLTALQTADLSKSDRFINNPTLSMDLLTSGISNLQELIIALGMVAFVWMGVFEAMKDTYAHGITESIKGAVEGTGKTLAKFAVGSIPLFPTARGPASIGAVGVALSQVKQIPDQLAREEAGRLFPGLTGKGLEAEKKLGESKTLVDAKKLLPDISQSQFKKELDSRQILQTRSINGTHQIREISTKGIG